MPAMAKKSALTFQELLFSLQRFWAEHGCVLQQPYDLEVGAGTMSPDTFPARAGAEAGEHCLCAAIAAAGGWTRYGEQPE